MEDGAVRKFPAKASRAGGRQSRRTWCYSGLMCQSRF
jgi:hypothetical protein